MARTSRTARKRATTRSSPASIIREYQTYTPCQEDDLGEFLSRYRRLWSNAHEHGVTCYDGIIRLIELLPADWQGWAKEIAGNYFYRQGDHYDSVGDFPQFIGTIHYCFDVYGQAPRGPYLRPGDYVPMGKIPRLDAPHDPPQIYAAPTSHSVNQPAPKTLLVQTKEKDSTGMARINRLAKTIRERRRKGKAPVRLNAPKKENPEQQANDDESTGSVAQSKLV